MSPIHHAAAGGNRETVQYLVDLGANISEKDRVGTSESKHHCNGSIPVLDLYLFIYLLQTTHFTFSHY